MDPVPDPLLFSGSAGNRTRASGSVAKNSDHCVCVYVRASALKFLLSFIKHQAMRTHTEAEAVLSSNPTLGTRLR
jgi:hypothetical protein